MLAAKLPASVFEPVLETLPVIIFLSQWPCELALTFTCHFHAQKKCSHDVFVSQCAVKIFCFVTHQSTHSAYHNNQIIHACFVYA